MKEPSNQTARYHGQHKQKEEGIKEKGIRDNKDEKSGRNDASKEGMKRGERVGKREKGKNTLIEDHHLFYQPDKLKYYYYRMKSLPRYNFQEFLVIKSVYKNIKEKPLSVQAIKAGNVFIYNPNLIHQLSGLFVG